MSAPLTNSTLWDSLYEWVTSVLPGVEVVISHEDAPSPAGNFVCIDYAGSWQLRGSTASRMVSDRPDLPSPRVYTYTGSVQIRDVDGDGENLMLLLESLENIDTLSQFESKGFSVLRSSGPMAVPALQQSQWRKESILTLELAWTRAYAGSEEVIESVEITQEKFFNLENERQEKFIYLERDKGNLLGSENLNKFTIETQEATNGT